VRERRAHFRRCGLRRLNVNEFALANPRAPLARPVPRLSAFDQFRPVRKAPALRRLDSMNAAAATREKFALRMSRHAQAPQILRPVNVAPLEISVRNIQKCREASDVFLGQVNEALLLAAPGCSRAGIEIL
jgi:hypothetical protein